MTGGGGGDGYNVTETALAQTAAGLNGVIHELQSMGQEAAADVGRGFSNLKLTGMQTGHDGLTSAFDGFCDRWEWGVRTIVQDADQIAQRLGLAAGTYYEMDQYAMKTLKVVVASDIGNPNLTEEQEENMSWSQIGSDNPINDFLHPDYSAKSAQQAFSDMGQTWKDTAHDMSQSIPLETAATLSGHKDDYDQALDQVYGPTPEERAQQQAQGGGTGSGG
ncbi:hypothetical protein [Actinacidiphila bryophytorum]|jgi:hypothetical protein|uniref:hypothetical protein n=1 Tax=Actinacidiphila bryophytorum TaxID=1436133 RepID=UPI002176DCCE|nr:hypothetical protein [Actinacidiphila bryophytorum]UWE11866.1 hypothetical protein NYE86_26295 [Actinacidiphila bryophytorum]